MAGVTVSGRRTDNVVAATPAMQTPARDVSATRPASERECGCGSSGQRTNIGGMHE